nr:ORF1b [Dicentrarchus labrax virus]
MLDKFDYSQASERDEECWDIAMQILFEEYAYMDQSSVVPLNQTEKNTDSTPGFPKKIQYQTEKALIEQTGLEYYIHQLEMVHETGYRVQPLWYSFPKYEIIKTEKIQNNDIRMIMCTDPGFTRIGCMFDQNQNKAMKELTMTHEAQVGWSPFKQQLDQRMNRLLQKGGPVLEIDWTRFDGTIPAVVMEAVRETRKRYLELDEKQEKLLDWYNKNLVRKFCVMPSGDVVHLEKGNPSGQISTSGDNCMANTFLTAYETSLWWKTNGLKPTVEKVKDSYNSICYGDDRLTCYKAKTLVDGVVFDHVPTEDFLVRMYKEHFGMWVKPENVKIHETLEGASFCGMTLKKERGLWLGVYNVDKIIASVFTPKEILAGPVDYLCKMYSLVICTINDGGTKARYLRNKLKEIKKWLREQDISFPDLSIQDLKDLWTRPQKEIECVITEQAGETKRLDDSWATGGTSQQVVQKTPATAEKLQGIGGKTFSSPVLPGKTWAQAVLNGVAASDQGSAASSTNLCEESVRTEDAKIEAERENNTALTSNMSGKGKKTAPKKGGGGGAVSCRNCNKWVQRGDLGNHNKKCTPSKGGEGKSDDKPKNKPQPVYNGRVDTPKETKRQEGERKDAAAKTVKQRGERWCEENLEHVSPAHVHNNRGLCGDYKDKTLKWTDIQEYTYCSTGEDILVFGTGFVEHPYMICAQGEKDLKADKEVKPDYNKPLTKCEVADDGLTCNMDPYFENPEGDEGVRVVGLSLTIVVQHAGEDTRGNIRHTQGAFGEENNLKVALGDGNCSKLPAADGIYMVAKVRDDDFDSFRRRERRKNYKIGTFRSGDREEGNPIALQLNRAMRESGYQQTITKLDNIPAGTMVTFKCVMHREYIIRGDSPHTRYATDGRLGVFDWKSILMFYDSRSPACLKAKDNDLKGFLLKLAGFLGVLGTIVTPFVPGAGAAFGAIGAVASGVSSFL